MMQLSVVLATRNEEANIERCLRSVKDIADEIIVVDEQSSDKTVEIAKRLGAKVYSEPHHKIFHITKQKAIDYASGYWILQLDADEVVTEELSREIGEVINMNDEEILARIPKDKNKLRLFNKHQEIIKNRDNLNFENREVVAFLIPRLNIFLGKPLRYAGVYPDPAIRLIKKGKAYLPGKSVHEIMKVDGGVAWLFNDMEHYDSPTFARYLSRANRYTSLTAAEYQKKRLSKNIFTLLYFSSIKPLLVFLKLYFRNKGFKDGIRGFLWSAFSALHFPLAYYKYWTGEIR